MAEPKFEEVENWLLNNADKEGTPDYVKMANAYRALDPQKSVAAAPTSSPGFVQNFTDRFKAAMGMDAPAKDIATSTLPDINDLMAAKRLTSDPYSVENTADRALAGAIGGVTDLGIGGWNAGARTIGAPESQVAPVTPQLQANAGAAPLPADASTTRQLLEGGLSAFLSGGAGAAGSALNTARTAARVGGTAVPAVSTALRMAAPTVLPTLGSHIGAEGGGYLGEKFLGDRETGAYLGSLLGGATAVSPAIQALIHQRYTGRGSLDAPDLDAMARRQGVTPTAGMLGDDSIMRREQTLVGQAGGAPVVAGARTAAREGIGNAYDRSAANRGAVDASPTESTIGAKVNQIARETADQLQSTSDQRQIRLQDRIGADAPVPVTPYREAGYDMMTDPHAALSVPSREAIDYRVTDQLAPLLNRDASGQPLLSPGPGGRPSETVPYGPFRGHRTDLGRTIDTPAGGRQPPVSALYPPATEAMRWTAGQSGVRPGDFNNIQQLTRDIMRETPVTRGGPLGDVPELNKYIHQDPSKSYDYLRSGDQNPAVPGLLDATQHPRVGEVMGDLIRKIGNETINNPLGGARGPANLTKSWSNMDPDSRATVLGPELNNVADAVALARSLDIPTSQQGMTRALGQQGEGVGRMMLGSETLGGLGHAVAGPVGGFVGKLAGIMGMPAIRSVMASVLEGPTARNALIGGQGPGGIQQLAAALTAAQTANEQQRGPRAQ